MKSPFYCFFLLVALLVSVPVCAQTNRSFVKGYHGNVELGNYATFGENQVGGIVMLATTHGYSTGTGMFVGAGVGYGYDIAPDMFVSSAFLDFKYNFVDTPVSPFLAARTGARFGFARDDSVGQFVSLACGVDFGRFSARVGYEYASVRQQIYLNSRTSPVVAYQKPSQFYFSIAFVFGK